MEKPLQYAVRSFKKGDEAQLAKIYSECFRPITSEGVKKWYQTIDAHPQHIFVGEVDRKPVSAVALVFKPLHLGEDVYVKTGGISTVCTDSDYRNKGIVTNLMRLTLNRAEAQGASNSSLFTGLDYPSRRIYFRLGFTDIAVERTYIKYLDFPLSFARWIRTLNLRLKHSKMAQRKLQDWEKSVIIELKEFGVHAFRFKKGRFQKLKKPPKKPDIIFVTSTKIFSQIIREGVLDWEQAVKDGKITFKHGEPVNVETLRRILRWKWAD